MKRVLLLALVILGIPCMSFASPFFEAFYLAGGKTNGPEYVIDQENNFTFGGSVLMGSNFFVGVDVLTHNQAFTDTPYSRGLSSQFTLIDALLGGAYLLPVTKTMNVCVYADVGVGGYRAEYTSSVNDGTIEGICTEIGCGSFVSLGSVMLGAEYKLNGLIGSGWYGTFNIVVGIFLGDTI